MRDVKLELERDIRLILLTIPTMKNVPYEVARTALSLHERLMRAKVDATKEGE